MHIVWIAKEMTNKLKMSVLTHLNKIHWMKPIGQGIRVTNMSNCNLQGIK